MTKEFYLQQMNLGTEDSQTQGGDLSQEYIEGTTRTKANVIFSFNFSNTRQAKLVKYNWTSGAGSR